MSWSEKDGDTPKMLKSYEGMEVLAEPMRWQDEASSQQFRL